MAFDKENRTLKADTQIIREIRRYPVKSMQGEKLLSAHVGVGGIPFDRCWSIRDEERQVIRGAKHFAKLLQCAARILPEKISDVVPHVAIEFPWQESIRSDDSRIHQALSDLLGKRVSLVPLEAADNKAHYALNDMTAEQRLHEWRQVSALQPDEDLPDMSDFPTAMRAELRDYATPRGTYFDAYPINILSQSSLNHLAGFCPDAELAVARFRPNFFLSGDAGDGAALLENGWIGQQISAGDAHLSIVVAAVRCVMVTREQGSLPKDMQIMRALVASLNQRISVYAEVNVPGVVNVGDPVAVLSGEDI